MRPFSVTALFVVGWYSSQFLIAAISFFVCCSLTLFVPSNCEWVTSPGPSNIGAKRLKVGVGQEEPDKNAHIATVTVTVLPSLSGTISLSSSPIYSESSTHPSSMSSTLYSLSSSMWSIYPMLQKTNISLISNHIFVNLNVKMKQ